MHLNQCKCVSFLSFGETAPVSSLASFPTPYQHCLVQTSSPLPVIAFTSPHPKSGQIGILDAQTSKLVDSISVGGYLSDLVADGQTRRLFVADAWNGRVLVIDSTTNGIVTQVKVPQVWALDLRNGKLFAVNHHQRQLFVLDAAMLKPIQTITPLHLLSMSLLHCLRLWSASDQ